MLTDFKSQIILPFQQRLEALQMALTAPELDLKVIQSEFHQVQQFFREQMMTPSMEGDRPTVPKWQSYLTETHKQMRLLTVDFRLLQSARQGKTAEIRQGQMISRLETLISYCQGILAVSPPE